MKMQTAAAAAASSIIFNVVVCEFIVQVAAINFIGIVPMKGSERTMTPKGERRGGRRSKNGSRGGSESVGTHDHGPEAQHGEARHVHHG